MKKAKILLLFLGAIILASCSNSDELIIPSAEGRQAEFNATIGKVKTRASGTNWDANDAIGIYALGTGKALSTANIYDKKSNVKYITAAAGANGNFVAESKAKAIILPGDGAKLDFIAYYPYHTNITADYKYEFNVATQTNPASIDLLYAKATGASKAKASVPLAFNHKLSLVTIDLKTSEDVSKVKLDQAVVKIKNAIVNGAMNLADGTVTAGTTKQDVSPVVSYQTTPNTAKAVAILVPGQKMAEIKVEITLANGKIYEWTPPAYTLTSGTASTYTLSLTSGGVQAQGSGTINNWGSGTTGNGEVDPKPASAFSVDKQTITLTSATGSETVNITATDATLTWTTASNQNWLTLDKANGTGSSALALNVTENTTGADRNATVTITPTTGTAITIAVTQKKVVTAANVSELFISEYVEGSSNNKYIEIYNGTGTSVDLSQYSLKKQTNGAGNYASAYNLTGTLANGEVIVLANNSASIYTGTVTKAGAVMSFNGNDAVALFKGATKIDEVGIFNDVSNWGKDTTLRRKSSVTSPNATYNVAEWDKSAKDDVSGLGSHTMN